MFASDDDDDERAQTTQTAPLLESVGEVGARLLFLPSFLPTGGGEAVLRSSEEEGERQHRRFPPPPLPPPKSERAVVSLSLPLILAPLSPLGGCREEEQKAPESGGERTDGRTRGKSQ